MLSEKTWRSDAVLRLILSCVICVFAGSFLIAGIQAATATSGAKIWVFGLVAMSLACLAGSILLLKNLDKQQDPILPLAAMLGLFCAGLMLGRWAFIMAGTVRPSIGQMIVSALSLQGAILVLLIPFLREHGVTWREAFGFNNRWVVALGLGILVAGIFLPIGWFLQNVSAELMLRLHLKPEQQQVVQTLQTDHAAAARAVFGVITIALVPAAEESFFRGILYPWIKRAGFPRLALWVSSLLFAAVHLNLMSFIPLALFAFALALVYEATNNLLAPITAHALFNAVNFYFLEHALR